MSPIRLTAFTRDILFFYTYLGMGDGFSNNQRSDNYSGSGASRYNDGARDSGNRQMNDFRYYSLLSAFIYISPGLKLKAGQYLDLYIQGGGGES